MVYTDDQIRQAVDAVFDKFDTDKNGSLDANETRNLINTALTSMNAGRQVSEQEVAQFMGAVDSSKDGKIQK